MSITATLSFLANEFAIESILQGKVSVVAVKHISVDNEALNGFLKGML